MPFGNVTLVPGIDTETTPTASQAAINSGNMVRWKEGLAEKIGGWTRFYPSALTGVPRDLHAWQGLSTDKHLSVATTTSLNIITSGVNQVVTPQTTTTNTAPNFTTVSSSASITVVDSNISNPTVNNSVFFNTPVAVGGIVLSGLYQIQTIIGTHSYTITSATAATGSISNGGTVYSFATTINSATVTVTLANHGYSVGQTVSFLVSTTVGGLTIFGSYLVQTVGGANTFTINAASQATSSTSGSINGGNVQFVYYIAIGPQATAAGYGTGTYGGGGYGIGIAPPSGTGTPITSTDWTQDNWGEVLLACPQNGPIYSWSPDSGFQTANIITQAPIYNGGIFVAMPQQILVAWGSSTSGSPDPLKIRWSDSQDYTDWTPTTTTFAGSFKIPTGSRIMGGLQAPQQALIWTDLDVWSMQYVNLPLVFGFTKVMTGCGLIGSHAATILGNSVYWMSQKQFFVMGGGGAPRALPCRVWDAIFQNLNLSFVSNIRAGTNSTFNEVWWHYPSVNSANGENDSYVKYTLEGEWDYGALPTGRTAWIDQSVLGTPIGADPTGLIFQHEMGYDGDGAALNPFFVTGYWVIGEAEEYAFVDELLPDFIFQTYSGSSTSATMLITLYLVDYPSGSITTKGPFTVTSVVPYIANRCRGRQMAMRVESQDAGSFWRLGKIRFRWAPDGRR